MNENLIGKKVAEAAQLAGKLANFTFTKSSVGVYAFETVRANTFASPSILPFYNRTRVLQPLVVGDFRIVPYGEQNFYPEDIRLLLDEDNFLPQGLKKDFGLIYGQGPALYKIVFQDGKRIKQFQEDEKIQAWLDSWDYKEYLLRTAIEYTTVNGHFTKYYRNRGARIGNAPMIAKLEHVSSVFARLEYWDEYYNINNIIVGDFRQPWQYGLRAYPVFNPGNAFGFPVSMRYSNLYNYALDFEYSRSPFHGAINWIKLNSSIPKLLSNFNENAMAIKYHIKSPALYWENKAQELKEKCLMSETDYTAKMLDDLKDETFLKITTALTGVGKAGKMITTETMFDGASNEYIGWEIEVLDQKVKDFIDAQIGVASEASKQVSVGIGLPQSLSNLSEAGSLSSGSDKINDFKLFLMTSIDIPEGIIMKDINIAIKANFPGTKLQMGFYHDTVLTEEATNPKDRIVNKPISGTTK